MKTIRYILQPRAMLILLTLVLTMKASSGGCECKSSSSDSSATTPPPNPQVSVQNLYGVAVSYEIWTGSNLEYREGTVYGDNLSRIVSITNIGNGATSSAATISYNGSFLLVIGVLDGSSYVYITNRAVNGYTTTRTFTLQSSGTIN